MAQQITVNMSDAIAVRLAEAMSARGNRPATVPDPANPGGPPIPNPETKAQFTRKRVFAYLKREMTEYEAARDSAAATAAAIAKVESEVTFT